MPPLERLLLVCLLLVGCGESRLARDRESLPTAPHVDVLIRARPSSVSLLVDLEAILLVDETGAMRALPLASPLLSSADAARQVPLASGPVAPGGYRSLVLRVRSARVAGPAERTLALAPPGEETEEPETADHVVPLDIEVRARDAVAVFLDWDVEASVDTAGIFTPRLAVRLEQPQVRLGHLYVADAAAGTVLSVSRQSGEVVSSARVGTWPRALALGPSRQTLYAANEGDGSLSVVDLIRSSTLFTVPVGLSAGCSDVVLAQDGRIAAVANSRADTVSLVDTQAIVRITDVRVGQSPVRLAVGRRSERVFVVSSRSDEVSAIDVRSRTVVATRGTRREPADVAVGRRGQRIYIGHRSSVDLLTLDAVSLSETGTFRVGDSVTALLPDRDRDLIYVARNHPAEIAVFDAGLSAVTRRIPLSAPVVAMALPTEGPLLYGAAPDRGGLVVVNVSTGKEESFLRCGTAPVDVVAVR